MKEFTQAFWTVENNRTQLAHQVPAELLKYSFPVVADLLVEAINVHVQKLSPPCVKASPMCYHHRSNSDIPTGSYVSLRPTTLLSTTRKIATSNVNRIRAKVDSWLSPGQSGFWVTRLQNTADSVWVHRWNFALTCRFHKNMYIS